MNNILPNPITFLTIPNKNQQYRINHEPNNKSTDTEKYKGKKGKEQPLVIIQAMHFYARSTSVLG